jgi:hypothetical protein
VQINEWPHHGLQVRGTLTLTDVEPLVEAVRERGASSIHLEEVRSLDRDTAITLLDQLPTVVRSPGTLSLHVVRGPVAAALEDAGFKDEPAGPTPLHLVYA